MTRTTIKHLAALIVAMAFANPAAALCIQAAEANLRQGPGTRHEISWQVFRYMPLKKIGQQGQWYKVKDVDGDTHWVHRQLVTDGMRCAVVKSNVVNVRVGPGTGYAKAPFSPVEKYYSFKVTGAKGGWIEIQDDVFNTGWVSKALLWIQ